MDENEHVENSDNLNENKKPKADPPESNPPEDKKPPAEDAKKYTDADLDAIISQKFAKWKEKQEKELSEAKKLAEMDAQQKAEYERDKLRKELDQLKRENTLNAMGKTARGILSERGINLPDEMVSMLVTEEAETTKANVDKFAELFSKAVDDAVTEKLKSKTPSRMAGGKRLTTEEILNIKDDDERRKAIAENMELFNN